MPLRSGPTCAGLLPLVGPEKPLVPPVPVPEVACVRAAPTDRAPGPGLPLPLALALPLPLPLPLALALALP